MEKYKISVLIFALVTVLLLASCSVSDKHEENPPVESSSISVWIDAPRSEASFYEVSELAFRLNFDSDGGRMLTKKIYSSDGLITMPYARRAGETLLGWTNDYGSDIATYAPGIAYKLDFNNSTPFFYAVWGDFSPKNVLQVNAEAGDGYIVGEWANSTNGFGEYSSIQTSGCGIVSLVSAIYNLGGTVLDSELDEFINEVFDWAYQKGYWRYELRSRRLFSNADYTFGEKYNFTISTEYRGTATDLSLISHLKNGGTAIVHVHNHFMVAAGYKEENGIGKFLIFDPAPGNGTEHLSKARNALTNPEGDWIPIEDLKDDGGKKGETSTKEQRMENIEIDAYWLLSHR